MDAHPLVLIVDDDTSHLRLMEVLLAKMDCNAVTADHPKDALDILKTRTPDLIILDVHMPDLNGIDLCGRLRGVRRLRDVPIILVSNQLTHALKEQAKWEGITTMMEKPLPFREFQQLVGRLLARREPAALPA